MVESNGVENVSYECEIKEGEHPPLNFEALISSTTFDSSTDFHAPDLNVRITDMGFPNLLVIEEPTTCDRTPSLIMRGRRMSFNNVAGRYFLVIEVSHPTILQGHMTYRIRDLGNGRFYYLVAPIVWTAGEW